MAVPLETGSHASVTRRGSEPTGSTGAVPRGTQTLGTGQGQGQGCPIMPETATRRAERSWRVFCTSRSEPPAIKRGGSFKIL